MTGAPAPAASCGGRKTARVLTPSPAAGPARPRSSLPLLPAAVHRFFPRGPLSCRRCWPAPQGSLSDAVLGLSQRRAPQQELAAAVGDAHGAQLYTRRSSRRTESGEPGGAGQARALRGPTAARPARCRLATAPRSSTAACAVAAGACSDGPR